MPVFCIREELRDMFLKNMGLRGKVGVEECFVEMQMTCHYEATTRVSSSLRFKTKERIVSFLELFPKQYEHLIIYSKAIQRDHQFSKNTIYIHVGLH